MRSSGRKYPRAPLSGSVRYYEWNEPLEAKAAEISASGIFLCTRASLPEGSMLTLRLHIPGQLRPFTALGKVVRTVRGGVVRTAGMGIQFVDIAAGDRKSIAEYVARKLMHAA